MSSPSIVACPHCNGQIAADPSIAGKQVGCPHCNGRIIMPGAAVAKTAIIVQPSNESTASDPLDFLESSQPQSGSPHSTAVPRSSIMAARGKSQNKSGVPVWVWIGAGAFGFMVLLMCIGIASQSSHDGGANHGGGKTTESTQTGIMTRDEFRRTVMGKTPDQVVKAVGRPNRTQEFAGMAWVYDERTKDPVTGNVDTFAIVAFHGGVVWNVTCD